MSVYARDGGLWVDVSVKGFERVRTSANTFDPKLARKFEKNLRDDIKSGHYVFVVNPNDTKRVPLTLEEGFAKALRTTWAKSKDVNGVTAAIRMAEEYFGKDTKLRHLTTVSVNGYSEWLQGRYDSPASVNRKLSTLQRMITLATTRWGAIETPVAFDKLKENKGRIRTISFEVEELLAPTAQAVDPLLADLVVFLVETGCRLSEGLKLTQKDIFTDHVQFWNTKHEYRAVPLSDYAKSVLVKHQKSIRPFAGLGSIFTVERKWRKVRELMGEDETFIIHALRHTFATRMVEAGVDIYTISKYLGHANVTTTERYAKITPVHLRSSMRMFEALRSGKSVPLLRGVGR